MGAKTHWPWTCHVLQTKRSKASGFDNSSRIFTWNTCLTRSLACSGIAEQERATFAFCQACWPFESLDSNESLGPKLCCWTAGAINMTWFGIRNHMNSTYIFCRPHPPCPVTHCQFNVAAPLKNNLKHIESQVVHELKWELVSWCLSIRINWTFFSKQTFQITFVFIQETHLLVWDYNFSFLFFIVGFKSLIFY